MKQINHFLVWLPLAIVMFMLASLALLTNPASASSEFTTTWKTDIENSGDASLELAIYRNPRYSYNYTVDWGDGTVTNYIDRNAIHTYDSPGTYQVKISGSFPRLYLANGADAHKLVSVDGWGDIEWQSMSRAFEGARNMTILATDTPDTSAVSSFSYAFKDATQVTGGVANWDVSNGTDFRSVFENASSFNESLANWNVANMTLATSIFAGSGMSTASYDATLLGWETTAAQSDVDISPIGLPHCQAAASVAYLTDTLNWTISDEGQDTSLCGPTDIELTSDASQTVAENSSDVVIGVLSAVDIEQDQSYTYSVGCPQSIDNSFFTVNGNELILTEALDYENPQDDNGDNTYIVCVTATDDDGFSTDQEFEINITDVEEIEPDAGVVDGGAVLSASTDSDSSSSDDEGGQVLGTSSEGGAVLAETGQAILLALFVGIGLPVIVTILLRKSSIVYSLRK